MSESMSDGDIEPIPPPTQDELFDKHNHFAMQRVATWAFAPPSERTEGYKSIEKHSWLNNCHLRIEEGMISIMYVIGAPSSVKHLCLADYRMLVEDRIFGGKADEQESSLKSDQRSVITLYSRLPTTASQLVFCQYFWRTREALTIFGQRVKNVPPKFLQQVLSECPICMDGPMQVPSICFDDRYPALPVSFNFDDHEPVVNPGCNSHYHCFSCYIGYRDQYCSQEDVSLRCLTCRHPYRRGPISAMHLIEHEVVKLLNASGGFFNCSYDFLVRAYNGKYVPNDVRHVPVIASEKFCDLNRDILRDSSIRVIYGHTVDHHSFAYAPSPEAPETTRTRDGSLVIRSGAPAVATRYNNLVRRSRVIFGNHPQLLFPLSDSSDDEPDPVVDTRSARAHQLQQQRTTCSPCTPAVRSPRHRARFVFRGDIYDPATNRVVAYSDAALSNSRSHSSTSRRSSNIVHERANVRRAVQASSSANRSTNFVHSFMNYIDDHWTVLVPNEDIESE